MKTIVLGSGSKGNSTLLVTEKKKVLIDVGFSYPKMKMLLEEYGYEPGDIDDILITHTHKDHILGLASFIKKNHIKVYTNTKMSKELNKIISIDDMEIEENCYDIDDLHIDVVPTSHDAVGSVGFIICDKNNSLAYITDTGYLNQKCLKKLINKNLYIFESNHDINLLMNGPYPYILKQRVVSDKGHLSNEMAGNYLKEIIGNNTKKIVLAHLSEINNEPSLAIKTVSEILNNKDITITVASQDKSMDIGEF